MKGIPQGMALTLRHFFSRSVTIQYPYEKLKLKDRFRGQLALVIDPETKQPYCTACGLCAKACPDRLITVTSEKVDKKRILTSWQVNLGACMFCGLCVETCPFDALTMSKRYELAEYDRRKFVYGKDRLLAEAIARAKEPKAPKKEAKTTAKPTSEIEKTEITGREVTDAPMGKKAESGSQRAEDAPADDSTESSRTSATEKDNLENSASQKKDNIQLQLGIDQAKNINQEEKKTSKDE